MTQKLSTYFPSLVCSVQADGYQLRPLRPQPIAMWLPERLLPRRAQCELAIQASVGAYHISDEWSFGWHALKTFVVLKVMERRLLLGHDLEVPIAKPAERKLQRIKYSGLLACCNTNACFKVNFLQIIDENSLCLVSIMPHDI
jgi:hypothetical protein